MAQFQTNLNDIQRQFQQLQALRQLQESQKPRQLEKLNSAEPIVGYRVWSLATVGGMPYLRSSTQAQFVWPYRKAIERDVIHNAGIHAVKHGQHLLNLWNEYHAEVAGEVYLWGQVIEHTEGYLAEFAYPKQLFVGNHADAVTAMQLEQEYGVPISFRDDLIDHRVVASAQQYAQQYQQAAQQMQNVSGLYPQGLAQNIFGRGLLGGAF